jgi:NTP pyrophosphatase (non-canonical NTP hydrolase)
MDKVGKPLTFGRLRVMNVARCEDVFHRLKDWTLSDWGVAAAGEVGETCNVIKKLRRYEDDRERGVANLSTAQLTSDLAKEIADSIIYLDLLAARAGIDLEKAIVSKFNEVSDKRGSRYKL